MKEEYILTQNGQNYDLILEIINRNTLRAHCHAQNDTCKGEFIGDYTLQELRDVNEIFYDFNNLEDALTEMDEAIVKNLCGIIDDEDMFEVVVYLDRMNKKAKVPLLLEWEGECRLHSGMHSPDIINQIERSNNQLKRDQNDLRRQIDNALMGGRQPYSSYQPQSQVPQRQKNYPPDEYKKEGPFSQGGSTALRSKQPQKNSYNIKKSPYDNDFVPNMPEKNSRNNYLDSKISSYDELGFVLDKIKYFRKVNLLYRGTRDGDKAQTFHALCDGAKSTLILIQAGNGKRFGGYTIRNWAGDCEDKKDCDAFVFSLDKKKIYEIIPDKPAIGAYPEFGPIFFGCQIRVFDNFLTMGGSTYKKQRNYKTEEDFELSGGYQKYSITELEAFEIE